MHSTLRVPIAALTALAALRMAFVTVAHAAQPAVVGESALWAGLRNGTLVAIIRHADAPGFGDPPEFRIGDCSTQRNLSAEGRAQARRLGERFRAAGIARAKVLSSQWCRCVDTATQLGLGTVETFPTLNSFFQDRSTEERQTGELRELLLKRTDRSPLVLVTHQVNITGITGEFASPGEVVVLRVSNREVGVAGRIAAPR